MSIKTKKSIRKEYYKKLLEQANYKVFPAYRRTGVDLYALLVIACNKLNPEHPDKAFYNVVLALENITQGKKCKPEAWKRTQQDGAVNED